MFSDLLSVNIGTSMDKEVTADTEARSEAQRKRFEIPTGRTLSLGGAESSGKPETRKHERNGESISRKKRKCGTSERKLDLGLKIEIGFADCTICASGIQEHDDISEVDFG